jgi:hypothetical protein
VLGVFVVCDPGCTSTGGGGGNVEPLALPRLGPMVSVRPCLQSYGALHSCDVSLNGLDVLCRVLDVMEHLTHGWLLQHLANEREGRFNVGLDYVPWNLIGLPLSLPVIGCMLPYGMWHGR